jgi:hypothetical protein
MRYYKISSGVLGYTKVANGMVHAVVMTDEVTGYSGIESRILYDLFGIKLSFTIPIRNWIEESIEFETVVEFYTSSISDIRLTTKNWTKLFKGEYPRITGTVIDIKYENELYITKIKAQNYIYEIDRIDEPILDNTITVGIDELNVHGPLMRIISHGLKR